MARCVVVWHVDSEASSPVRRKKRCLSWSGPSAKRRSGALLGEPKVCSGQTCCTGMPLGIIGRCFVGLQPGNAAAWVFWCLGVVLGCSQGFVLLGVFIGLLPGFSDVPGGCIGQQPGFLLVITWVKRCFIEVNVVHAHVYIVMGQELLRLHVVRAGCKRT